MVLCYTGTPAGFSLASFHSWPKLLGFSFGKDQSICCVRKESLDFHGPKNTAAIFPFPVPHATRFWAGAVHYFFNGCQYLKIQIESHITISITDFF